LEEGQSVKLSVLREGKTQQFDLKAERRESWDWASMLGSMPDLGATLAPLAKIHERGDNKTIEVIVNGESHTLPGDGSGTRVFHFETDDGKDHHSERIELVPPFRRGAPWASLNLSTLNPELGRYFGTDHGVLVLNTSENALKELNPGDVIHVVDGQPADSVSGVMRALSRKEAGQPINVEVWRDRKRQVLAVIAPERDHFMFSPPAPPLPPVPPSAPAQAPVAPVAPVAPHAAPKANLPAPPAPPTAPAAPPPPPRDQMFEA
jgi:PDZ domain